MEGKCEGIKQEILRRAYDSADVTIEMTDASRPIVVRSEGNPNMTVLSMPMQVVG